MLTSKFYLKLPDQDLEGVGCWSWLGWVGLGVAGLAWRERRLLLGLKHFLKRRGFGFD